MPRISEMIPSKYLKKEDCASPLLLTIRTIATEDVGTGDDIEEKWILYFEEKDKGMVLNSTNMRLIEMVTGSDDTDNWIGKKVVIYNDPNVSFGGKLTGGIRVRAPKAAPKTQTQLKAKKGDPHPSESLPPEAQDDDIPF